MWRKRKFKEAQKGFQLSMCVILKLLTSAQDSKWVAGNKKNTADFGHLFSFFVNRRCMFIFHLYYKHTSPIHENYMKICFGQ